MLVTTLTVLMFTASASFNSISAAALYDESTFAGLKNGVVMINFSVNENNE